ncbi:autotransporter outer membrane beta-barrel domain-containing protein [Cedecea neteri]|uniref:autotransporter family protein n=1 Tax=Cedecea neteri TaxID=158822 RepID=UPI0028934B77|nr:autotransporter outer membrane beta-barrel domain-containing protein [Cedecea neteri]WNJ79763.1 autotransporter outer membrane beta-barrel domain-containing protein [Cedecea neteri]
MKNKALTLVPVCLVGFTGALPLSASAACSSATPNSGDTVTCSGSGIPPVVATAGSNNVTINLDSTVSGSYSLTTQATPFSVDSGSNINNAGALTLSDNGTGVANRGALLLGVNNGNTLTNGATGMLTTTGAYNDGMAANGNNNTLINNGTIITSGNNSYGMTAAWGQSNPGAAGNTITNTGTISTSGNNARAISLLGGSGTVNNSGTLTTSGRDAPTVFLQGNNATLNNSGLIQTTGTASSSGSVDGVVANTLGSSFNTTINNLAGGKIISNNGIGIRSTNGNITITNAGLIQGGSGTAILSGNGSISLILQTGSQIIGLADGGLGNNSVTLEGTGSATNDFVNFKTLTMNGSDWTWAGNGSFATALMQSGTFDLAGTLGNASAPVAVTVVNGATLGGYGTVNGDVVNGGRIAVANALTAHANAMSGNFQINGNLTNTGLVQLGGSGVGNSLTVAGNYSGQNGMIALNSVLAGDGAESDKLILSGGSASGSSTLKVTNLGGAGAPIVADGIQVVQATNGATSTANAFTLSGGTVSAGAYSYYLAKGGVSDGSGGSWYLRNTVVPDSTTSVTPAEETSESIVDASHGNETLNVYRPEVALYAEAPAVARQLNLQQIDTFHDRQGEQSLLSGDNKAPAFWARSWGSHADIHQSGDVNPSFNGTLWGLQLGQDLYTATEDSGATHHLGILFGFSRATGDVDGFALAKQGMRVGKMQLNNYNYGGYWTRVAASGWYTDAVLMGSALRLNTNSVNEVSASSSGNAVTGSVETGLPVSLGEGVTLEPQAQLVWQRTSLDSLHDGVSDVRWNNGNTWQGRVGARLQWAFEASGVNWKPYLRANVLRSFGQDDETAFDGSTTIANSIGQTAGQIGAGLVAQVSQNGSLYATTGYLTNFGGERQRVVTGNVGVRWIW